jgi:hypothetical protein
VCDLELLLQPLDLVLHRLFVAQLCIPLLLHHPHLLPQLPIHLLLLPQPLLQLIHLQDLSLQIEIQMIILLLQTLVFLLSSGLSSRLLKASSLAHLCHCCR